MKNDPQMQQCLAVYVRDVIGRAKQPDCAERAMVVQLGTENPSDSPCTMFTEGVAIPLYQLAVVMNTPDKNIVIAEFDRNRRHWWTASEEFQIKNYALIWRMDESTLQALVIRTFTCLPSCCCVHRRTAYILLRELRGELNARCTLRTRMIQSSG